jgi:hypothetical protein
MAEIKLSQKEYARRMRRAAYLRAKEQRAKDPKCLALKEAAKLRRREAYRKAKDRKQAKVRQEKASLEESRAEERAASDLELMKLVKPGFDPGVN